MRDHSAVAVLAAKLVNGYFPKIVELHNYSSANSIQQKQYNWRTLNRDPSLLSPRFIELRSVASPEKVFSKMGFSIPANQIDAVCNRQYGGIERVLHTLKIKVEEILAAGGKLPAMKEKVSIWKLPPQKFKPGKALRAVVDEAMRGNNGGSVSKDAQRRHSLGDAVAAASENGRRGSHARQWGAAAEEGEEGRPRRDVRPRRASLEIRSQDLKSRCEASLGEHFQKVYDYLKHARSRCEDARGLASPEPDGKPTPDLETEVGIDLCSIVGPDLMGYTKLVEQLLFIEECLQPKANVASLNLPVSPTNKRHSLHV